MIGWSKNLAGKDMNQAVRDGAKEITKTSDRIAILWAEIRNRDFSNLKQE
jgi:hypothetical protein